MALKLDNAIEDTADMRPELARLAKTQAACSACVREELALRKLWMQVQERAHPTDFTWHCLVCGKENHIVID